MTATGEREKRVAVRRVEGFAKQYGEAHRHLARHGAFPLVLTPDLLYQIWANFVPEAPWTAVAHVLLSRLCRQVGYEMYEMDIADRNLLLRELKEECGQERFDELGEFLLDYVAQRLTEDDPDTQDLREAQEWTALAYTKPDEVAYRWMETLSSRIKQKDITEIFRLASLVETFAEPLLQSGFEPLLVYADEVKSFIQESYADEAEQLEKSFEGTNNSIEVETARVNVNVSQAWQLEQTFVGHSDAVSSIALSPNGKILASGSLDTTINLWNVETQVLLAKLVGHSSAVLSVAFSPDGKKLASSSNLEVRDGSIKLWDIESAQLQQTLGSGFINLRVSSLAFSPDGQVLASGHAGAKIQLWLLGNGKPLRTLMGHGWDVNSLAFSPDGRFLVSGGLDGAIKVWNWRTGEALRTLKRPPSSQWINSLVSWFDSSVGFIWSVAVSPDGKTFASAGSGLPIELWELETGKLIRILTGHSGAVYTVSFSSDGKILASGGEDNTVKLWNIQTGELLHTLEHLGPVKSVVFSSNGQTLFSGSSDTQIKTWRVTLLNPVKSKQESQTLLCAVILTAIPVEYVAVRAHLKSLQEEIHPEGTVYERGRFFSNGQLWQVGIVEIGAGNTEAAVETKRAIDYFRPSVVLFVGVAGGLKDVTVGDVVVATKVYGYESGKVTEEAFLPRPNVSLVSYRLEQRAKAEAKKEDWLQRIEESIQTPKPRALIGAIAAGDKVVASTRSDIYQLLRSNYGDALAVEMESHGFLKAVRANPEINALIVRGISDLIDGKSNADAAGSQEKAARNASAFAFEILAKLNVNPGIVQTTDDFHQTTDALIKQVEQYLSDPNCYILLNNLVLREAQALAEVMQGELEACPWVLSIHNQQQCQQCIEYLEAKSERLVRMLAKIVYHDRNAQFISSITRAFRTLARQSVPINTNFTDESKWVRLYPLALAIYAVFIVGVQEEREQHLRTVLGIRLNRQAESLPNLSIIYVLSCLDGYSRSIFNAVLDGTPYLAPVAERIKRILLPWLEELLPDVETAFYQGEFVLGLANIEAPPYLSDEKRLDLQGLYLYYPPARPILKAFLSDSSEWLVSLYPSLEELLDIFDATASRLDREGWGRMHGFCRGSLPTFREEVGD